MGKNYAKDFVTHLQELSKDAEAENKNRIDLIVQILITHESTNPLPYINGCLINAAENGLYHHELRYYTVSELLIDELNVNFGYNMKYTDEYRNTAIKAIRKYYELMGFNVKEHENSLVIHW